MVRSVAQFSWQTLLSVSRGQAVSHHRPFDRTAVETDTRTIGEGCFFVPLKGENFVGDAFIAEAYNKGAEGSFVEAAFLENNPDLKRFPNLIAVENVLTTYQALANFHRRQSQAAVIAITGSSGKTTVKEMLYQMLASVKEGLVQKSEKNFNNDVGVALTLLNLKPETEYLIVEMGMRGLNQIAVLSHCAQPDMAIITNIGPAHIGLLGSIENIAQAKCEIFQGMEPEGSLGIINGDDPVLTKAAADSWEGRLESFSLHEIDEIHTLPEGKVTFQYEDVKFSLGLPGSHNVLNALACIKACENLEIPLKKLSDSLSHFEVGGGRGEKTQVPGYDNLWLINDAYNANPASMRVALATFMESRFENLKKVAVIGEMAELGSHSEHYHREIGEWLNTRTGLNMLITIGEGAKPLRDAVQNERLEAYAVNTAAEAAALIQAHAAQNAILLLKGSRVAKLEEISEQLKAKNPHAVS